MEDEDGESKIMDMWSILGDQQLKDPTFGNTLKHSVDNVYIDTIEEGKRINRYNSVTPKDSPSRNTGSKIVFKGFKKRILAQAQEIQSVASKNFSQEQISHSNVSGKINKEKRTESKRGKITEYAQYLGLQPSSKLKCSKCHSSTNSTFTNLKQSQCVCNTAMAPMQGLPSTSETSSQSHAANFKITRKVYLCAACGTYFENWNLFLHMRDIHKRHICLFCLGMFGQAERLSYHLSKKHSVPEMGFNSVEDFYSAFKGSCYLVCCTCEKMFSETDNFYNHFCSPPTKQEASTTVCSLCQTGSHANTCALAVESNKEADPVVPVTTTVQTGTVSTFVVEKPANGNNKGTSRKVIKNNRNKHGEDSISNSCQQHAKKVNAKALTSQSNENKLSSDTVIRDGNVQDEINVTRDTVSETIMEVSKCIDDSRSNEVEQKEDHISSIVKASPENSLIQNNNEIEPYDSVTQTIMEVSRCTNDTEEDEDIPKANKTDAMILFDADITSNGKSQTENKSNKMDSIPLENTTNEELHEINSEHQITKDMDLAEKDEKVEEISKTKFDLESHSSSSPVHSPISRSLFSPQHESQQDLQPKEEYPDDGSKHVEAAPPTESQTSVSFNTAPASDRSLVIKICTNKNSQFSVSSTGNVETHNISRDSEENNNAEESTSEEKLLSLTQNDKDNVESNQINEADSDSDSYKLAVIDSNAEDDINELDQSEDIAAKPKSSMEMKENTSVHEEKEEFGIGENANGEFSTTEPYNDVKKDAINCASELASQPNDGIVLAGEDVPPIDLNVEGTLDSTEIEDLLKKCIEAASPFCVYCNHARHIAVNGKQLGLHMLSEHKFHPQHPAIIIQPEQFTVRVKKSLEELETNYFNLDTYSSTNGTYNIQTVRTYECFHCRYNSAIHKELYTHHRKMHQKTILICIMCKSTFYSYSELLCHLCPGVYSPNINVKYRCCLCSISSLPSAFRLMVHLRKSHHACDVCLETTGNQQRLSNHVWKHKLHHLCYRCGIAYRNKPDITKHLFWKHGTESVLCKKCLQKKWPHIYHFCIPPTAFVCEECGSSFSRAVALKVHKRLHSGDQPYSCSECSERFISQRLLTKHEESHKEPPPVDVCTVDATNNQLSIVDEKSDKDKTNTVDHLALSTSEGTKDVKETVKKVVDVYDLPPLNLSSDSESETEEAKDDIKKNEESAEKNEITSERGNTEETVSPLISAKAASPLQANDNIADEEENEEEKKQEAKIMDGIWDNFKSYTASLEMQESVNLSNKEPEPEIDVAFLRSIVLADHDYCVVWSEKEKNTEGVAKEDEKATGNVDFSDYTNNKLQQRSPSAGSLAQNTGCESDVNKKKGKSPKKKKQNGSTSSSDSSSESDSSSCSCGTNCSCSSSSSGSSSSSSSSSDSDSSASESSPRKSSNRKERKKEKEVDQKNQPGAAENENKEAPIEVDNVTDVPIEPISLPKPLLRESDLETDETLTDEDFYDEHPQQLANKLLAEKRNQLLLLAAVAPASTESGIPLNNGITDESCVTPSPNPTPSVEDQPQQQKKKVKTKKRKRGERGKQRVVTTPMVESLKLNIPKAYYQKNSNFSVSSATMIGHHQHHQLGRSSTPNLITNDIQTAVTAVESHPHTNQNIGGSGSETENKRSSKRKRIPKRFYGDSSDEETEKQPTMKWRKVVEAPSFVPAPNPKPLQQRLSFGGKTVAYRSNVVETHTESLLNVTATSATESEGPADSSSESSGSDVEMSIQQQSQSHVSESNPPITERPVNLYCYCQCPYDEVSEMIACDGEDCRIEWFHFECVGIMVPPKGKWYCPDCRKKHGIVQNREDYFD